MDSETRKNLSRQAIAQATRYRLKSKKTHTTPIDPIQLAEDNGCEVRFMSLASVEGMYSPEPRPTIIVGSQRPAGRRNFTCAHELGHHLWGHGMRLDELTSSNGECKKNPEEFIVDTFAGHLLMPQLAVHNIISKRRLDVPNITPEQVYILASYFGVGYSTIINHLTWGLNIFNKSKSTELLNISPKMIKVQYGAEPSQEIVFVDQFWQNRSVDLEVGDVLILSNNILLESEENFQYMGNTNQYSIWRAEASGYTRGIDDRSDWAINIRIARKWYEGLARYRFYAEIDEELQ